jgi:hypothetical protein
MSRTDTEHPAIQPPPAEAPPRALTLFVQAAIVVTALVFVLTVALIFVRWATVDVPSGTIIVLGSQRLEGAIVALEGVVLDEPRTQTISADRRHTVQFFLHPGSYRLTVTWHDHEIMIQVFDLPPGVPGFRFDLSQFDPETLGEG